MAQCMEFILKQKHRTLNSGPPPCTHGGRVRVRGLSSGRENVLFLDSTEEEARRSMRREGFVAQVVWASRPCFLAEEMHGRDAHATSLPVLNLVFLSVSSSMPSVSSVAPPGHQINKSRCGVRVVEEVNSPLHRNGRFHPRVRRRQIQSGGDGCGFLLADLLQQQTPGFSLVSKDV